MVRRFSAKVDRNQAEIVAALRGVGATVEPTQSAGSGFPDLVVGFRGVNYLIEVKDGDLPPSARNLTAAQKPWHADWRGQVGIANNVTEALGIIGVKG